MRTLPEILKKHRTFITYIAIGFSGFFLDLLTFTFLLRIIGINQYIANPISTSLGIINNFLLNAHFNFKKKDNLLMRFISFYAIGWVGIALGELILWIFTDFWGAQVQRILVANIPQFAHYQIELVKIASLFVIAVVQYTLNKNISFGTITDKNET